MTQRINIDHLVFKDTSFAGLMTKRVLNVLLIATRYDAFMLEEDGRIDEQIFNEYTSLSLRYPPRFTLVTTEKEAVAAMRRMNFDLVICMPNMDDTDIFAGANRIKSLYSKVPIVVLTPFSREVTKRMLQEDLSSIDYVFSWLGNSELLLAIIKLIEDKMNVDDDIASVGVQTILLVEDSIRFYSSALPHLYKFVLEQSKGFSKEALNAHQQTLRMRGRPKILLARSYEEAEALYLKYKDHTLGIVCDMSFCKCGVKDPYAGYKLGSMVRNIDRFVPIIFDSSEVSNKRFADELHCSFIDKNSKTFPQDLRKEIKDNFGFGDFVILDPQTKAEIIRITSLKDLQTKIFRIPDDSLVYHLSRNHFSRFFYSRAIFPIAEFLKGIDVSDYASMDEARRVIFDAIVKYREMKNSGIVAVFEKERFDEYSHFARIGEDSLGGKGRGLAFISRMIKRWANELDRLFPNTGLRIPKTVVLCTDIFDEFMEMNDLYRIALQDLPDGDILKYFLRASLPKRLIEDLLAFFEVVKTPVVVRSSSLLEDSHYQPFAGVYKTYMIPHVPDKYELLNRVGNAIKGVYASVFYRDSKAYMTATQNLIDQEKMAIVLQEMVGQVHGTRCYPDISGVARSLNFYPVGEEKGEEGIVSVALGLGKYIVDGGVTLRFSPKHPDRILQTGSLEFALKETQTRFYALDLQTGPNDKITVNDASNLLELSVKEADKDGAIRYISSTYNPQDHILMDGYYPGPNRKVITFSGVLHNGVFPLAGILDYILKLGQAEIGRPVEIEFAVNLEKTPESGVTGNFYLLQLRPIVDSKEVIGENLLKVKEEDCLLQSVHALGHGITGDVYDVIYVKTAGFSAGNNPQVAGEIERFNREMIEEERNYILVGPGRWGSSDPWLGIPVKWAHISNARLIVESGLDNYRVEPSQGTHFFHNLTSFGVGYFTINPYIKGNGIFDEAFLNAQPAEKETKYLRHVRFEKPVVIKIDGKKNIGVALKPFPANASYR
ncbi:MAG: phosphoenolpyruvate synthase [Dysgonamonadaceae bacterium]|jgi:CheY-like chemotaxis protein|nr:phosphoenolpyruvate synthase [Dysgonamonadaceae bacterium]